MFTQINYLIRSKKDGKYLAARNEIEGKPSNYLLIFTENFEALSYINTHAPEYSDRFGVESVTNTQLKAIINRWSFQGVGIVKDPILPKITFKNV